MTKYRKGPQMTAKEHKKTQKIPMDRKGPIKSSSVVTDSESTTIYADFRKSVRPDFFAAVNNGFGLSVRELIFTYQVAAFQATLCNSGCRTAVIVL